MGQPVVHFEVIGKDAAKLQSYYGELFGWDIQADNPLNCGLVQREENVSSEGVGICGGVGAAPEDHDGPETVVEQLELGMFNDPEGHLVGVVKAAS